MRAKMEFEDNRAKSYEMCPYPVGMHGSDYEKAKAYTKLGGTAKDCAIISFVFKEATLRLYIPIELDLNDVILDVVALGGVLNKPYHDGQVDNCDQTYGFQSQQLP